MRVATLYNGGNNSMHRFLAVLLLAALAFLGCESATSPVAPEGTVLTIRANPENITVNGTSIITVTAFHSSGVPAREGTQIQITTSLGTIEKSPVSTDSQGVARSTLRAGGRAGTADVTATSGTKGPDDMRMANSVTVPVMIGSAVTLTAAFTPVTNESLTVSFNESSTGNPTSWEWQFGDGSGSTEREPMHTYPAPGSYLVTLTVRNADSQDSVSQTVVVPRSQGTAPMADFDAEVDGLRVTFTDMSLNNPSVWEWSFGDGGTSAVQNPVHVYGAPGIYTVSLTVRNAAGESSTSQSVTVPQQSQVPDADFAFDEVADLRVLFRDTSTQEPTNWNWDFGDGGTSTERNPEHIYGAVGTYTVSLTAGNLAGQSTETRFITVCGLEADFAAAITPWLSLTANLGILDFDRQLQHVRRSDLDLVQGNSQPYRALLIALRDRWFRHFGLRCSASP